MSSLIISEIFGPTVQGEGPTAGRLCCFLRLSNCNLTCKWCDTPYTWDWNGANGKSYKKEDEQSHISESEVLNYLIKNNVPRLVISGGEPLMQGPNLISLCGQLTEHNIDIEIETNGTVSPPAGLVPFVSMFNCSPKLEHSGVLKNKRFKPAVLKTLELTDKAIFKFVVQQPSDLDEVEDIITEASLSHRNIWIMPEGRSVEELNKHLVSIADEVIGRGWNLTTRLQVLTWGAKRGH